MEFSETKIEGHHFWLDKSKMRMVVILKSSNSHIFATGHLVHVMYVQPLYFALGHYPSPLTHLGDWRHFASDSS